MSNFLNDKVNHNPVIDISIMNDKIFIKEFSKEFYQKIINIKDIKTFEITLSRWIKNLDKSIKSILELMKNHNKSEYLFSSIIGFFYQYGIGCNVDKNKALELYLLAVNNNEKPLNESLQFLKEENDNEFDIINNNNIIIGKYLLSLFYYKDIILDIKTLGYRYQYGQGVVQNYEKAFKCYLKSAKYGCAESQYNLGLCYKNGIGTDKDYDKAFKWYSMSANNESALGQYGLGLCYHYGIGTNKDYSKAFEFFLKSANNGCAKGQYNLGYCYYNGIGINKNYKKAFKWYLKSAESENAMAKNSLGECYYHGKGVKQDYKVAFTWYLNSANDGCVLGMYNLGVCYYYGIGTKMNRVEATFWYKKASDNGIKDASSS